MFGGPDVPSIEKAEERVKRRNSIFLVLATLLLAGLFYILYSVIVGGEGTLGSYQGIRWVAYTFLGYIVLTIGGNKALDRLQKMWGNLGQKDMDQKIGGFTVGKILEYTQKIADDMDIKGEKVQVCTMDSTLPNAFGLLWRNVICLDESWLRLLDEKELKALISHELYHLKLKRTRPMFGHPLLMRFVIFTQVSVIMAIIVYLGFWEQYFEILFLIFGFQWINTFFFMAPMKASRAEEHLCDWSAVKYTGIEGAINLMLKLGQRYEAANIIQEAVKEETKEYSVPIRDYTEIQKRIDQNLVREKMDEEGIKETVRETVQNMAREKNWRKSLIKWPSLSSSKMSRATRKHKINWLEYDNHIQDFKLDKQETREFIRDIMGDRKSFLFDSPIDSHRDSHGTHPTIKQRVLFLWKNYRKKASSV